MRPRSATGSTDENHRDATAADTSRLGTQQPRLRFRFRWDFHVKPTRCCGMPYLIQGGWNRLRCLWSLKHHCQEQATPRRSGVHRRIVSSHDVARTLWVSRVRSCLHPAERPGSALHRSSHLSGRDRIDSPGRIILMGDRINSGQRCRSCNPAWPFSQ